MILNENPPMATVIFSRNSQLTKLRMHVGEREIKVILLQIKAEPGKVNVVTVNSNDQRNLRERVKLGLHVKSKRMALKMIPILTR